MRRSVPTRPPRNIGRTHRGSSSTPDTPRRRTSVGGWNQCPPEGGPVGSRWRTLRSTTHRQVPGRSAFDEWLRPIAGGVVAANTLVIFGRGERVLVVIG